QTALARDPALPPGSDFQTAIQGAHHLEKRGVARWLMNGVVKMWEKRGYLFFQGRFFSPHARKRLRLDPQCVDPRMFASTAIQIINRGTTYWDTKKKRFVYVLRESGGVVISTPGTDMTGPPGSVVSVLTWQEVRRKIASGRFQIKYSRQN
ncbi:MAG: hypothetical protein JAY75_13770, partial [Candidatus Thiodiazotropha taylori]|nr:hypothetical protein [Candidatus Thiodiazotropha taylori]MCW4301019.1 hypothetical protein [Candidatus Thiodiazotropha endolucinida]MCG8077295.1 hypothetical protein [Candidatus Thiodiazotropha taylori]MCG8116725.1 hypothetical protein [Candidatus Thiodiazotropha taylori]MCW4309285.1 hypothetical protein [Candidatus Thiodiazotropha endolucinida]